ncbi:MAG: hypothetical protein ACRECP_12290 [Methylocella sp.]
MTGPLAWLTPDGLRSRLPGQPEPGAATIAIRTIPAVAESHLEEATLAWLGELGPAVKAGPDIGPDGAAPKRRTRGDVAPAGPARAAIVRVNPRLTAGTRDAVFRKRIS